MVREIGLSHFVFVHSVPLIDLLESRGTFAGLKGHTYVLLGPRERHEELLANSSHRDKVIFAALLPNNIEDRGNLLQFTGWHALASNALLSDDAEYVGLYEYDIEVPPDFDSSVRRLLSDLPQADVVAFLAYPKHDSFLDRKNPYCHGMSRFLEERLKLAPEDFLLDQTPDFLNWTVTSNVVFKRRRFLEFMRSDYMSDLLAFLGDDPMGGHALERSISVYYMLKQWNAAELLGQLTHISADSHGTQGHKDRYDAHYGVP